MVLQQNAEAAVWGYASPGSTVTVTPSWDGKAYLAKTDPRGHWTAYLKTPPAGYDIYSIAVDEVPEPKAVRYGWADFRPGNIHSVEELPLVPFCLTLE